MHVRRLVSTAVLVVALLAGAVPAAAHTGLQSSTPADGATVDEPVTRVLLVFTEPVELVGAGVELLDDAGDRVPGRVVHDGARVRIRPDTPLTGGDHGVRWAVRAGDGHPVRGTLRFAVDAAAPPDDAGAAIPSTAPEPSVDAGATGPSAPASVAPAAPDPPEDASAGLTAALTTGGTTALEMADTALRALYHLAALGALGVAVFLAAAWEGPRWEVRLLTRLVTRLGLAVIAVVALQLVVRSALIGGSWDAVPVTVPDVLTRAYAAGTGLRVAGALLLVVGAPVLGRHLRATHPIAGASVDVDAPTTRPLPTPPAGGRGRAATLVLLGVAALAASSAFVGHAATGEPRVVAVGAAVAHVLATGIWGGGILALAAVLADRRRRPSPNTGLVVVRFSVVATAGILIAAAAGVALAVVRLDSPAMLWTTPYGVVLLAKLAVVAVVAAVGAYNHFVIVPTLRRIPDHVVVLRLRRLAAVELVGLAMVVGLTSVLVTLAG